jgi:hypothetical protein
MYCLKVGISRSGKGKGEDTEGEEDGSMLHMYI